MDGANKAMKAVPYSYTTRYGEKSVEAASMFDINKTLMRCLVKNLAMFGMGIYIYAGEDLPDTEPTPVAQPSAINLKKEPTEELPDLKKGTENWDNVIKYVTTNKELGMEKIGKQLTRKYKISPTLKKEIAKLITE
jgi:NH3-dependent NAD+ synthetase